MVKAEKDEVEKALEVMLIILHFILKGMEMILDLMIII